MADEIGRLIDTLVGARSYKVRLQAAGVLARMRDPRVAGALARAATADDHPLVRVYTVKLLARNPGGDPTDERARAAIAKAMGDGNAQVRAQAARSLAELNSVRAARRTTSQVASATGTRPSRSGSLSIAVRGMGDRTGRAPSGMKEALKAEIIATLRRTPRVMVADPGAAGLAFVIDGTIARFEHTVGRLDVETLCAVELVVSRPPRGIVLVASGEAIVQKPRMQFRPAQRPAMDTEAMQNAVKSAHENLARFFAAQ